MLMIKILPDTKFFPKFGVWMVQRYQRVYHINNTKHSKNNHILRTKTHFEDAK